MKPIAITDDITTCDCCSRTGLKRTVVLRCDGGSIRYYGTSCAAKAIYGYSTAALSNEIRKAAITEQFRDQQNRKDAARKAASAREALELLANGATLNHPAVQLQHRIWRQVNNPLNPGPEFTPWKQWLTARADNHSCAT